MVVTQTHSQSPHKRKIKHNMDKTPINSVASRYTLMLFTNGVALEFKIL